MRQAHRRTTRDESRRGFTLIELLVAMVITVLLIAGTFAMIMRTLSSRQLLNETSNLQRKAQRGMDVMVDELRLAQEIYAFENQYVEPPIPSHWITFRSFDNYLITYYLDNETHALRRRVQEQDGTLTDVMLTDDVHNVLFYPYHVEGNMVGTPKQVYFLVIKIEMRSATQSATLSTGIRLRNLLRSTN